MTALKPLELRAVRGVASVRYPLNTICAHPECDRTDVTAHHLFPRSQIGNSSWFVEIGKQPGDKNDIVSRKAIPHVVGLCGHGTDGHHGDLEEHRAWVRYMDDQFVWWDRVETAHGWLRVGALDPQPAQPATKRRRRRKATTPEERRARKNYTIKTPKGEEQILPELCEAMKTCRNAQELGYDEGTPDHFLWAAAAIKFIQNV